MTEAAAPAVVAGPRAECTADSGGLITIRFALPEAERPALLLRLRPKKGRESEPETVLRLPLEREDDGRLRAVLDPREHPLAEGRWDLYAVDTAEGPGGPRRRLTPGVRDLRALLGLRRALATGPGPLVVRIPYPTADGHLAVRAWRRKVHAEAGDLTVADGALTVRARLIGARLGPGAAAVVRRRGGGEQPVVEAAVRGEDGGAFSFTIAYRELTGAHTGRREVWDVYLRPDAEAPQARVGRLLDDVWEKKNIFTYPATVQGKAVVRPYYTVDNDLSLEVGCADAVPGA